MMTGTSQLAQNERLPEGTCLAHSRKTAYMLVNNRNTCDCTLDADYVVFCVMPVMAYLFVFSVFSFLSFFSF